MTRSGEKGIALIITMFMVLILSLIGSSLMFVSRTETLSSLNYQTMSQVRYAAESGVHSAANHILWTYLTPGAPGNAADPWPGPYNTTVSPVTYNGATVVLSSDPAVASNYPVAAVRDAFSAATQGTLSVGNGTVAYRAVARLISMRQINDVFLGPTTVQTWEITGTGNAAGAGSAELEVTATIERQDTPLYKYAAFATDNGCDALKFGGNSHTDSYNSATYGGSGTPAMSNSNGDVGTNGNLDEFGSSQIYGSLSTPRTGVGACSAGNVTALTGNAANVSGGLVPLSQAISYPSPGDPNPLPPQTNQSFQKNTGCPAGVLFCSASANGATFAPPTSSTIVSLGNISITANAKLHLGPGIYHVNSISFASNAEIIVDGGGPVTIKVAGKSGAGELATPIDLTGGSLTNQTYDPSKLQFIYNGTGTIKMTGGSSNAALMYSPNATVSFTGNSDFYGAVVGKKITDMGNAAIHYDRNLMNNGVTTGNPVMDAFNWRNY